MPKGFDDDDDVDSSEEDDDGGDLAEMFDDLGMTEFALDAERQGFGRHTESTPPPLSRKEQAAVVAEMLTGGGGGVGVDASASSYEAMVRLEGLGNDFENSPWVAPSVAKAQANRERCMFGGGEAGLRETRAKDLEALGVGIVLYFQFLKLLACVFAVQCLLSIPALVFFSAGTRVPMEVRHKVELNLFT